MTLQINNFNLAIPDPVFRPTRTVNLPVPIGANPITNTQVGGYAASSPSASEAFTEAGNLKLKNIQQVSAQTAPATGITTQRIIQVTTKGNPVFLTYSFTLSVNTVAKKLAFFRDGMQISPTYQMVASAGFVTMTPCLSFIDTAPGSGPHTYELRASVSTVALDSFQVIELG